MKRKNSPSRAQHRHGLAAMPILFIAAGLALVLFVLIFFFTQSSGGSSEIRPVQIGRPVGNFTLPDVQSNPLSWSAFRGKVVLINIWATWCPPCRAEMPDLEAFYRAHRDQGFIILGLNAGDERAAVQTFAQSYGLTFPIALDAQSAVIQRLGVFNYPTSILVDRDGIVQNIQVGMYPPVALAADVEPLLRR